MENMSSCELVAESNRTLEGQSAPGTVATHTQLFGGTELRTSQRFLSGSAAEGHPWLEASRSLWEVCWKAGEI